MYAKYYVTISEHYTDKTPPVATANHFAAVSKTKAKEELFEVLKRDPDTVTITIKKKYDK